MSHRQDYPPFPSPTYTAHGYLHDGIEPPLWRVQVPRYMLLPHQRVEVLAVVGEVQHVLVAEGAGAVLVGSARVQQLSRRGADVGHDCLLDKGTKTFGKVGARNLKG